MTYERVADREARASSRAPFSNGRILLCVLLISAGATQASPHLESASGHAAEVATVDIIRAQRITTPVDIDAVLDDLAWQGPSNNGLIQNEPDNGDPPLFPTEWWVGYDEKALYAAFRFYDPAPDSIDAAVARRDASLNTDEVVLELDTFNDGRTGFLFVVNAGGYMFDAVMFNDGLYDNSWDAVWSSAAAVDDRGWTAEMRIPFSQLRFKPDEEQVWGINVIRRVKRRQSEEFLFHRPRQESGHNSRFPDLVGLEGIEMGTHREGIVYGVGKGEYMQFEPGNPFNDGSEFAYDMGADVKWGLGSNLTLNATINPDFGQVEVDPAVVNLSDSETFFMEKRPFFVQDNKTFSFGRDGTSNDVGFNWMDPMLFYSRRVGRNPQLEIQSDCRHSESPTGTTILGAGKLTGKIGNSSIGALSAVTGREYHGLCGNERVWKELAEPLSSYSVLRVTRTSPGGSHALGAMVTGIQRDLSSAPSRESLTSAAYAAGLDGWAFVDSDQKWAVKGYVAGSWILGDQAAIDAQQRSYRRYYQRPDADHLDYDPERRNLTGWSSRLMLNKQKGDYTLNTAVGAVSPGFEINDVGYQSRADVINTHVMAGRRWTKPSRLFRRQNVDLATYWTWDFGGTRNGGGVGAFYSGQLANYWSVNGNVFYNPESDNTRITRGGPIMRGRINREFNLGVHSDARKSWSAGTHGGAGWGGPGEAWAYGGVGFTFKPNPALSISVEPEYFWEKNRSQYVTTIEDPAMSATFGHRYLFADLEYREVSLSARADWAFTPRLTLQTYIQPLIAVADYQGIKAFARPGTFEFDVYGEDGESSIAYDEANQEYLIDPGDGGESFTAPDRDMNFKWLMVNMVLRWEYSPGSTFYFVWTRNGANTDDPGSFNLKRDAGALLDAPADDVVMVKFTRWFDF